jgi:hypothetical protein
LFALPQGIQMLFHELLAHALVVGFALRSLQIGIDRSACLGKARGLVIGASSRRRKGERNCERDQGKGADGIHVRLLKRAGNRVVVKQRA